MRINVRRTDDKPVSCVDYVFESRSLKIFKYVNKSLFFCFD